MLEHLKKSEAELNELFAEYWKLRHEAGKYNTEMLDFLRRYGMIRHIHGNTREQAEHESCG